MKKGFSLIEMLIYISLLAVVGVLIVNSMLFLAPSYNSLKVTRDINNAAVVTIERVTREIRAADSIHTANSVFNLVDGKLVLNTGLSTVSIYLSDGRVYVQEGVGSPSPLTREGIEVTSLIFEHFIGPQSENIQMSMTVEGTSRTLTKNETFYTAAVLRNQYTLGAISSVPEVVVETPDIPEEEGGRRNRHHHGGGGEHLKILWY